MSRLIKIFIGVVIAVSIFASSVDATITVYKKHTRTGGGADALDGIDGNTLVDGSMAFVIESDWTYFFENDATGTAVTGDVTPTANPGTNVWKFKWKATTNPVVGNASAVLNVVVSGASPVYSHTSGTSVASGTFVVNDSSTSKIYGLHPVPITGVSTIYVKFVEGAQGAGMTVYNVSGQPFQGDGLSGASYFALPPGNPHESATLYAVSNGVTQYWFAECTNSWVAGN